MTAQELQDALVHAIEGALYTTLPVAIRPKVVCVNDPELTIGNVQILIRMGMGIPSSEPALDGSTQPVPALTDR